MQSGKQSGKIGGAHSRSGDAAPSEEDQIANKLAGSAGAESVKTAVFAHHPPETVRFFLLSTHYRSPIDFSMENIAATGKSLEGFTRLFEEYERITGASFYSLEAPVRRENSTSLASIDAVAPEISKELISLRDRFTESMDDDFNTGGAVAALFDLRRVLNGFVNQITSGGAAANEAQKAALTAGMTLLRELAGVLGAFRTAPQKSNGADDAFVDGLMQLILDIRADARKNKNWPVADKVRDALKALNVVVEDRTDGVRWSRG
jgi:cysteinyl-tRNA synthetase